MSIYFLGDSFESGRYEVVGPQSAEGWRPEIERAYSTLGLEGSHPLSAFTRDVFLVADPSA
jgi:hypothetical protein